MPYKSNRMHIYLYSRAGARAGVGAVVVVGVGVTARTKAGTAAGPHKLLERIPMHICVSVCVFVVLVSACLHVCVELKKYDILSVKQALCQTNSHWLRYKRGIATLSCLPP